MGCRSLSLGKHQVRLISCFKPLPAKQSLGKAMREERPGEGTEGRRARGPAIHHAAGSQSPPDTAPKHSPTGTMCSQRPATPRWGSEQPHRPIEGKLQESVEFMPPKPGVAASTWEKNICQLLFFFLFFLLERARLGRQEAGQSIFFKKAKGGII